MTKFTLSRALLCLVFCAVTPFLARGQVTTTLQSSPESGSFWYDATIIRSTSTFEASMATRNYRKYERLSATNWQQHLYRSLIKIDVANLIPIGTVIQSAKLVLSSTGPPNGETGNQSRVGSNSFYLLRITQSWADSTVTWNNQPTFSTANSIAVPASVTTQPVIEIDVTGAIQDMLDHPETNFGFMMMLQSESGTVSRNYASSDEQITGLRPRLVVTTATAFTQAKARMDYIFGGLNQAEITSGILTDYGMEFADPTLYDGVIRPNNEMTIDSWRAVYGTLLSSVINPSSNLVTLKSINQSLETLWESYDRSDRLVDVPMQLIRYQSLRPDAVDLNLLAVNNDRLADVPGRSQTPYVTKYAFAAAPHIGYDTDGDATFIFRSALFVNSSSKTVSNLSVDFGNGIGYRTVLMNTPVYIQYPSAGAKVLQFKVTCTDNTVFYSHAKFEVYAASGNGNARYGLNERKEFRFPRSMDTQCPEATFPNPESYQGSYYGAEVTVHYGDQPTTVRDPNTVDCNPRFIRPLIVVEGYDVSKFSAFGVDNWDYEKFAGRFVNGAINGPTITGNSLNEDLDRSGYDLVFIDFNEGTGDIVRNAYLVENVIQWVNAHKINNPATGVRERNIVLGQSMGGLVARYALCDLEKRRIANGSFASHECRLLVTQDSPHRGANVPIGFQNLINKLATQSLTTVGLFSYGAGGAIIGSFLDMQDLAPALKQGKQLLNEPATRQMLIDQDGQSNTFLIGDYRSMITFSNGYTPSFVTRAIANGSECGQGQFIQPTARLLYADASFFVSTILFHAVGAQVLDYAIEGPYQPGLPVITRVGLYLLIPFTGKTWKTHLEVNVPNTSGNGTVFKGKIQMQKRILFLIKVNFDICNVSNNVTGKTLWDTYPGGYYDMQTFQTKIPGNPNINAYPIITANLRIELAPSFNFVPTVSALDIVTTPLTPEAITSPYSGGSNPQYPSTISNYKTQEPVDNFPVATTYNTSHLLFSEASATWLLNVVQGNNPVTSCSYACPNSPAAFTIVGPDQLCLNSGSYSVQNAPVGATFRWETANPFQITGPGNQPTATVTSTANFGTGTLVSHMNIATCGQTTVTKNLVMGSPPWPNESVSSVDGSPTYFLPGPDYLFLTWQEYYITVIDYPWKTAPITVVTDGYVSQSGPGYVVAEYRTTGNHGLLATTQGPCGPVSVSQYITVVGEYSRIGESAYSYYPNPVSDNLIIGGDPNATTQGKGIAQTTATNVVNIKLLDSTGHVVRNTTVEDGLSATFDTLDLPNGLYYINLSAGDEVYSQSIVIKH